MYAVHRHISHPRGGMWLIVPSFHYQGGGFQGGGLPATHPVNLVRNEQVIMVAIQYRVGALGSCDDIESLQALGERQIISRCRS